MIVVPLAIPKDAHPTNVHRAGPTAQLLAATVPASSRSGTSHSGSTAAASKQAWLTAVAHARFVRFEGEVRYQDWRRQLAYQSWRRAIAYAAWRQAVVQQAARRSSPSRSGTSTPGAPTTIHGERTGLATWYAWRPGQCATSYRPKGTRIWVTDLATGKTISCVVTDYQPYSPTHVVDLNEASFAELAPLSQGVVDVRVTW